MEIKMPQTVTEGTTATILGGLGLAALLWVVRLLAKIIGLPKRVANLERTQMIMVESQRAQGQAILLVLDENRTPEETEAAKRDLRASNDGLTKHIDALAMGENSAETNRS